MNAKCHLVSTVIPSDLFAQDEDIFIPDHFLLHGRVERLPDGHLANRSLRGIFSNVLIQ